MFSRNTKDQRSCRVKKQAAAAKLDPEAGEFINAFTEFIETGYPYHRYKDHDAIEIRFRAARRILDIVRNLDQSNRPQS